MPIIKSAKKRVRQDKKRRLRNKTFSARIKKNIKEIEATLKNKDKKKAQELYKLSQKLLHKAINRGILHKKTAARKISSLSRKTKNIQ